MADPLLRLSLWIDGKRGCGWFRPNRGLGWFAPASRIGWAIVAIFFLSLVASIPLGDAIGWPVRVLLGLGYAAISWWASRATD